MTQKIIDEYLLILIENKLVIIAAFVGFVHSTLFYYIRPGKKSVKGYLKFVLTFGKKDEPKA